MAIYKKVNGKKVLVASDITKHNQLEERDAYGCHPIKAIRNLPEKLTELKESIESTKTELQNAIQVESGIRESVDNNLSISVDNVEQKAKEISLSSGEGEHAGKIVFHPYDGEDVYVQGGYLPDKDTISLEDVNGEERLVARALKKADNDILSPEMIVDGINTNREAIDSFGAKLGPINDSISNINLVNAEQDIRIKDLQNFTKGIGGYLDSYNFGTETPTQEELTQYALQDIGVSDVEQIWNGTKVINLFDQHTWQWDLNSKDWSNLGEIPVIPDANNDGLHGLITGSKEDWKGFIDTTTAQISINGLKDYVDTNDVNITNLQSGKLDKKNWSDNTVNQGNNYHVYGVDSSDNQVMLKTNYNATAYAPGYIVLTGPAGSIWVPEKPFNDRSATSKQYVDNAINSIQIKTDNSTITKNINEEIQAVALKTTNEELVTSEEILEAITIRKGL